MITVLTGDNSFEIQQALTSLSEAFEGTAERIDGSGLELRQLPDLLMGGTLFADKRLVIIKDLSGSSSVWTKLPEWLDRISDDIHVVLVEPKPDKRTVAYKALKKSANVKEFLSWSDRDWGLAETWTANQAKNLGLSLDKKVIHHIVNRVGLDQWQLASALEKLSLLDDINLETVNETIDANPSENIFQLFESALEGNARRVHEMIHTLEMTEDPYQLFALLSSQAFQLVAVASAEAGDNPSKDFAIHPYVASKLSRHAKKFGKVGSLRILKAFADADADMKRSRGEPWLLIERALITISQ